MPLLQYVCKNCNFKFEELVKTYSDPVNCPNCGKSAERLYSGEMFSSIGKQSKKCSGNCKSCGGCK